MRRNWILATLVVAMYASETAGGTYRHARPTECPRRDSIHGSVMLPHESDCTKFYTCVHGKPVFSQCPVMDQEGNRLHFNPVLQVCDWPLHAGCVRGTKPTTVGKPTTGTWPTWTNIVTGTSKVSTDEPGTSSTKPSPTPGHGTNIRMPHEYNCSLYYELINGEKVLRECPRDLHFSPTQLVCKKRKYAGCEPGTPTNPSCGIPCGDVPDGWLIPHECLCALYYRCRNGDLIRQECSSGLHFNAKRFSCDYPEAAGCEPLPTTTEATTAKPTTSVIPSQCPPDNSGGTIQFPHPTNCSLFYKCDNGKKQLLQCPNGLHFNPVIQMCDWPDSAGCTATTEPAGTSDDETQSTIPSLETSTKVTTAEATVATPSSELPNECPTEDTGSIVQLPYPYNCSLYYVCENGEKVLQACPPGLEFSPDLHTCDWPEVSGCLASTTTRPETTTTEATPKPTSGSETEATPKPTTESETEATPKSTTVSETEATPQPTTGSETEGTPKPTTGSEAEATPKPTTGSETEATPKPTTVSETEATPKPTTGSETEVTPQPTTENATDATPQPTTERPTEVTREPTTGIATEATPEPTTEKATEAPPQSTTEIVTEATAQPTTERATEATRQPTTGIATEATPEPTTEKSTEAPPQSTTEIVTEATAQPTTGSSTEAPPQPTTEIVTEATAQPTTASTTEAKPQPTTQRETDATQNPTTEPSITVSTVGTTSSELPNECPSEDTGPVVKLPHPYNCSLYYVCENGQKVLQVCPEGLEFSPDLYICVWPEVSGCMASTTARPERPTTEAVPKPTTESETEASPEPTSEVTPKPTTERQTVATAEPETGSSSEGTTRPVTESTVNIVETECPPHNSGMAVHIPHPTNCSLYYKCDNGAKVLQACPAGLEFNAAKQVCDWPDEAGCVPSTTVLPSTTNVPVTPSKAPETTATTSQPPSTEVPVTSPQTTTPAIECPPDADGRLMSHETNCSLYYECEGGQKILQECTPGLHFSPDLEICVWPANAGCESTTLSPTTPSVVAEVTSQASAIPEDTVNGGDKGCIGTCPARDPEDYTVLLRNKDCTKFCKCSNSAAYVYDCPVGLHFNSMSSVCDFPQNAQCELDDGQSEPTDKTVREY